MNDDNLLSDLRAIALKNQYEAAEIGKRAADRIRELNKEREERSKGCVSCNGGFGDNTEEFLKSHYKVCPYCGRSLKGVCNA